MTAEDSPGSGRPRLNRSLSAKRKSSSGVSRLDLNAPKRDSVADLHDRDSKGHVLPDVGARVERARKALNRTQSVGNERPSRSTKTMKSHSVDRDDRPLLSTLASPRVASVPEPPKGPRILKIHFPHNDLYEVPLADLDPTCTIGDVLPDLCAARGMDVQEYIAQDMSGTKISLRTKANTLPGDAFCFLRHREQIPNSRSKQTLSVTPKIEPTVLSNSQLMETNSLISELLAGSTTGNPGQAPSRTSAGPGMPPGMSMGMNPGLGMGMNPMGYNPQMGMMGGYNPMMMGGMNYNMYSMNNMMAQQQMMQRNAILEAQKKAAQNQNPHQVMYPVGSAALKQMSQNHGQQAPKTTAVCAGCGGVVDPAAKDSIHAQFTPTRIYHPGCFNCSRCQTLMTVSTHYILGNKFLTCTACYQRLVAQKQQQQAGAAATKA